jgi:hypothetical protein
VFPLSMYGLYSYAGVVFIGVFLQAPHDGGNLLLLSNMHTQAEMTRMQRVKNDLKETARPMVQNLIAHINRAFEPIRGYLQLQSNELAGNFLGKLAGFILSPVFATALKNIQVVSGAVALAELVHVTSRITATCANTDKNPIRRAGLHMQR